MLNLIPNRVTSLGIVQLIYDYKKEEWKERRKKEEKERQEKIGKRMSRALTKAKCSIAEPAVAQSVLQRRIDFPQTPIVANIMGSFGPKCVLRMLLAFLSG